MLPPANGAGIPTCTDIFDQESTDSCFNVTTTVRINIVANAAAIGEGGAILGTLTISGISLTPTNQQTLSNIFEGLTSQVLGRLEDLRAICIEAEKQKFRPAALPFDVLVFLLALDCEAGLTRLKQCKYHPRLKKAITAVRASKKSYFTAR